MLGEIKIIAVPNFEDLAGQSDGYYGNNNKELDFRKDRGGEYVFAVFKDTDDPTQYITGVSVQTRNEYGIAFTSGGKEYTPVPFYQAKTHHDGSYRGGLNGRNYGAYGGAYTGQAHVYVSRTGNDDFNEKVLKSAYVTTTKPNSGDWSGPHAGGKRYFVFSWHHHDSKYKATGNLQTHERYCAGCKLIKEEPHTFDQLFGNDTWTQFRKQDERREAFHYKKCKKCGEVVTDAHQWSSYVSDGNKHNKKCLLCDLVIASGHDDFGKVKLPVDEKYHMLYCGDCGFIEKVRHDFGDEKTVRSRDCERTISEHVCKQCSHHAFFEETGIGHKYDEQGICTREDCLHPFERPAVEYQGNDSTFVVKNYGNLYWVADFVNHDHPKTNVRLAEDLKADDYMRVAWRPIGNSDDTPFQGTFDGGGHIINMLQTEEPVASSGYRGLFGTIAKGGTVKNLTLASCIIRGWDNVGGVAGVNNGTIDQCHVVFSILKTIGTGMNIGGICGLNRGTITGCTTGRNVWVGSVTDYAGGICGTNDSGTLSGNVSAAICGSGSDAKLPETAAGR